MGSEPVYYTNLNLKESPEEISGKTFLVTVETLVVIGGLTASSSGGRRQGLNIASI